MIMWTYAEEYCEYGFFKDIISLLFFSLKTLTVLWPKMTLENTDAYSLQGHFDIRYGFSDYLGLLDENLYFDFVADNLRVV